MYPTQSQSLPSNQHVSWVRFAWVIVLSLCLLCLTLLTSCSRAPDIVNDTGTQPATATDQSKRLGNFSRVPGTRFLYAQISKSGDTSLLSVSSDNYSSRSVINNLVFFDPTTSRVTRLLPTNDTQLVTTVTLPESVTLDNSTSPQQVGWFLYAVVKGDSNKDNKLNQKDQMVLAVTDAGGQGYTELFDQVDELYGHTLNDPNTMTVIYRKQGKVWSSTVNLQKRQVLATKEFPSLGKDVKLT
jgi:hypothetical protein